MEGGREGGKEVGGEGAQAQAQVWAHPPAPTHAAGEHAGGSLVEVEGADAAHAIGDEGQHVAAGGRALSGGRAGGAGPGVTAPRGTGLTEGDSHLSALEGDDHLVIGDEGRLGAVERDPHALLGAC